MSVDVIVPVLNERAELPDLVAQLRRIESAGGVVTVVDGGSTDGTREALREERFRVLQSRRGRARQMNTGADASAGEVLVFLHADTRLPRVALNAVRGAVAAGAVWGRFDVTIAGSSPLLPVVAWFMNRRSAITGFATGDQAIFCTRKAFNRVGGYREIPLMEDIELSRGLRRLGRPARLRPQAITSGRRWDSRGACRTISLMWWLRLAHWMGVPPATLATWYR